MYKVGNWVFADAGHHLKRGGSIAYFFEVNKEPIEEIPTTIDDIHRVSDIILWANNKIAQPIIPNGAYGDYKKAIIQKKYSNDDQIAIILNKDSGEEIDLLAYTKMQEWREWASIVAKKIMEVLEKRYS
jgi:hypothetical protein